jgi:hypothetical protein
MAPLIFQKPHLMGKTLTYLINKGKNILNISQPKYTTDKDREG